MRTEPSVDGDSARYTPLLPEGADLYVISGPKHGSGYHWYEVSPITFQVDGLVEWPKTTVGPGTTGWVPVASRDGEPWLAHGRATCPDKPKDVMALVRLSVGARLACFAGVPLTVRARILPCNCEVDPPLQIRPAWFAPAQSPLGSRQGEVLGGGDLVLVPPTTPAQRLADWPIAFDMLWLRLSPKADHTDPLPVGDVVTISGMFDHPAAVRCGWKEPDGDGTYRPTDMCRPWFVTTSIR